MTISINRFLNNIFKLLKVYIFFLSIFSLFRIWFLIRLGDLSSLISVPTDVLIAFARGIQYDTMIICYFLAIPFILYLIGIGVSRDSYHKMIARFISWFTLFILALAMVILFVDQYYYNYFQTHISVIIFGLADDDSQTVMSSVWTDYPIIRIAMVWLAVLFGFRYYFKRVYSFPEINFKLSKRLGASSIAVIVVLYIFGIRGSFGTYQLKMQDSQVSESKFINFLTINGIYALKQSFIERRNNGNLLENELANLKSLGYDSAQHAAKDYFEQDSEQQMNEHAAFEKLFHTTPKQQFLEKNKPNVVFVFMESMSNYNLHLDSKEIDLLGNLRPHFEAGPVFRNFVSSGNITIESLEYLMVNSPVGLSQTKYRHIQFPSSVAIPFKTKGYETSFITGGKINWRGMDKFASQQRFDNVKGMNDIKSTLAKCKASKWGVYDEYLFDYVFDEISAKSAQPKFYFVQTTTNHTPFELPSDYKPAGISLTDSLKESLLVAEELAVKNLTAFQYANNSLGSFLNKIKNSPMAENTIVVVTGDHNNLMLFDFDEAHQLQQRGVPLYMYIPEKYKPSHQIDTSRFGSHKDIFPTIFNLALSGAKYYSLGNNLLDQDKTREDRFYGMNIGSKTSFSANAAVNFTTPTLYKWKNCQQRSLTRVNKSDEASDLLKKCKANYALSVFYILNTIKKTGRS